MLWSKTPKFTNIGSLKEAAIVFNQLVITIQRKKLFNSSFWCENVSGVCLVFLPHHIWKQILWEKKFEFIFFFKVIDTSLIVSVVTEYKSHQVNSSQKQQGLSLFCRRQEGTHLSSFQDLFKGFFPLPLQPPPGTARQLCQPSFAHFFRRSCQGQHFSCFICHGLQHVPCRQEMMLFPGSLPEAMAQSLWRRSLVTSPHHCQSQTHQSSCHSNPAGLKSHHESMHTKPPGPG